MLGARQTTWPLRSCTLSISVGTTSRPPAASAANAPASRSTVVSTAPSAAGSTLGIESTMWKAIAVSATACIPTCWAIRSVTRFKDFSSAFRIETGPLNVPS